MVLAKAADWSRVRSAFDDLVELSPAERETRLAILDLSPDLLKETRDLLAAADRAERFMTLSPGIEALAPPGEYRSLEFGSRVGVFSVEALVGRGGHGEVYRAFRDDGQFDQQVALKLLRPEALSLFEGFRTERQILAGLEHPGIARLVDGGVAPDGRPYMAMEFVEGEPIDDFCTLNVLDTEARLRLMLEVCAAVAYAHAHLVVHGDIKPGNILVNAEGQPKLLDFGIARLMESGDATATLTAALSTPAYAAPEQLAGQRATIATDIYALGVVLYELLTGLPLWQIGDAPISWASRVLADEPPLASARLAREKGRVPASALRGDLDAIIAKALRARPGARYETVPALAEDIRRHLDHRPVLARNGNLAYRLGRFVRRNRVAVGAGTLLAVVVVGAAAGIGWNMQQAYASRSTARIEAVRGESLREFVALLFRAAYAHRQDGLHDAREILDATAAQLEADAASGPINDQLVRAVGELYFEFEEFNAAEPFFEKFLALAGARSDPVLVAQVERMMASIALRQGDLARTGQLVDQAAAFFDANPMLYARERAELDGMRAAMLRETGQREQGIALLRHAVAELGDALGPTSLDTLALRQNLAVHLITAGDLDQGATELSDILAILDATGREKSSIALAAISGQGLVANLRGDLQKAVALFGRAVALRKEIYAPSASLAVLELNYGRGLSNLGRDEEAMAVYDEAIAVSAASAGENGSTHVMLLANRGLSEIALGRLDAAQKDIEEALARIRANFGDQSQYYGLAIFAHAQLMYARGDLNAARADLAVAKPLFEAMGAGGEPYLQMLETVRKIVDGEG